MFEYITSLFKSNEEIKLNNEIEELLNIDNSINIENVIKIYKNIIDKVYINELYKSVLYIRDYKNGKGLRKIGNILFYLFIMNNELKDNEFIKTCLYTYLNEIGRWDDMFIFFEKDNEIQNDYINKTENKTKKELIKNMIIEIICNELINDYKKCKNGLNVSLCAKWCPSEGKSLDRKTNIVYILSNKLIEIIKKDNEILDILDKNILENIIKNNKKYVYRHLISVLRKKIDIIETYICKKDINDIQIEKVPKKAIVYHKKTLVSNGININKYINTDSNQTELDKFEYLADNQIYIKKNYLEIYDKYIK